jgi:hypothetical protein
MISCTGQGRTSSEVENIEISNIIDLTAGFDNIQTVRLSEIADSITFIPFETTRQSLMGMGQQNIRFSSHYIFYYDKYFDWNGKYLGSIVKKGNGPFEEPEGGTLLFKNDHFYSKGSKLIEYDKTGKPTGKLRSLYASREFADNDFLRGGVEFFSAGENFVVYNYPTALYYLDKNFEKISSRTVTFADSLPTWLQPLGRNFVTYYKDMALFFNFMNDTIFHVKDTDLEPRWIVSFDHPLRLTAKVILDYQNLFRKSWFVVRSGGSIENTELIQLTDHKHRVTAAYETESHVFFLMTEIIPQAEFRGKTLPKPYVIFFDKNTRKTTRIKGNGFVDDLLGMDFFYPQLGVFDEKMISYIWPYELLDYIEERKEQGREVNPQLIALSKKLKPDDNPVLIVAHLKKKS